MRKYILASAEFAQYGILYIRLYTLCCHLVQGGTTFDDHLFHHFCIFFQYDSKVVLVGKNRSEGLITYEGGFKDITYCNLLEVKTTIISGCCANNEGRILG